MNFVSDVLERFPASRPALLTIDSEGERQVWHFGELIAMSAGVSGALAARGVRRGDVVMTLLGNRIEWVLTLLACWRMGAVALPMSTQLRAKDLDLRVGASNPALCVGDAELLSGLRGGIESIDLVEFAQILDEDRPQETPAAIAQLEPRDPALIVFTSGTTGEPRGALHTASYLAGQRPQAVHWLGAGKKDLVWCTTATGWSKSARNVFVAPWMCGAAALISDARFDAESRLALVEREGVSVLCQAPTEYRMLAKRVKLRKPAELRRMVSAGEPLNPEVIRVFREAMGLDIHDGYGQTETGQVTGNLVGKRVRDGSMGTALPGFDLRIDAEDGEPGELQVRTASCPTFFDRYLDESRDDALARLVDGEWWPTGDVVRSDDDGYLFYEGRDDDLILSAGYRIGPFEVESALLSHPAVAEAAAIAMPDQERGAVVRAVVVLRDAAASEALAAELREHVMGVTAPYKAPRVIDFAEELPKTASGKIRRAELRG
ncbi:MAG: AMP-binding protein [Solirubrobacterales bacterium]